MNRLNRQIVLTSRPVGVPQPQHFKLVSRDVPPLTAGEFLVENLYLSVDPAQRGYVNDENNYVAPVAIGVVMRALAVGRVIASECPTFAVGDYVYGWFGWQDYCVCLPAAVLRRVDPGQRLHWPLPPVRSASTGSPPFWHCMRSASRRRARPFW